MNKNQNGFATLEIILILGIIAIFSTVAVPKMARILDKVALDYELKHLYSELNLARSIGKSSMIEGGIFPNSFDNTGNGQIEFWIYSRKYSTENMRNRYLIKRPAVTSASYYRHNLANDIKLEFKGGDNVLKIKFDDSQTINLISKYNSSAEIKIDTVGRIRGTYDK